MSPAESTKPAPSRRGLWLVVLAVLVLLGISTWDALRRDTGAALRRAAWDGDLKRMQEILRQKPDLVNNPGTMGLLMRLYSADLPEWLRNCLPKREPTDLEFLERDGAAALHCAIVRTNLPAIKLLLTAGASPDAMITRGVTPVGMAIGHQREDIVLMLLRAGASVNLTKATRANPLFIAAWRGDRATNVTRLLLNSGADPNAQLPDGGTPLHTAVRADQAEIVRMFLGAGARLDITNSEGFTPLGYAVKHNSTNTIVLLQSLGATP